MHGFTSIRRACVFLVFLLLAIPTAAKSAVSMDVQFGFDGTAKAGKWIPIAVKLTNSGTEEVQGTLQVSQDTNRWLSFPACTARVVLPPQSTKLYRIYAQLEDHGDVKVSLVRKGSVAAVKNASWRQMVPDGDKLVVSVGKSASRLSFLAQETVPGSANPVHRSPGSPATIYVGSIDPSLLPDRPSAYEGVDVLVISDLSPSSVDPKALKALCMWVASGGILVVSAGPNYRVYDHEFYHELLPVQITGAGSVENSRVLAGMACTSPPGGALSTAVSKARHGICTALEEENGIPIYARREYGSGRVVYLAFDHLSPPFHGWVGQTDFWKRIVSMSNESPLILSAAGMSEDWQSGYGYMPPPYPFFPGSQMTLTDVVQQNPSIKTPSFNLIGGYLLLYLLILVPANYFVLKSRRRLELAWVTVPTIVTIFLFGAYGIGHTMKGGRLLLNEATVLEGSSDSSYLRSITCSSIFSPARRSYSLSAPDPYGMAQALSTNRKDRISPPVYIGEQVRVSDLAMAMWSSRAIESTGGVDIGGNVASDLKWTGTEVAGTIKNNTPYTLKDCRVIYGGKELTIGALKRGGAEKIRISYQQAVRSGPGYPGMYHRGTSDLHERLMTAVCQSAQQRNVPILVARVDAGRKGFDVPGESPVVVSSTVCAFRLGYGVAESFHLPPGSASVRITHQENAHDAPAGVSGGMVSLAVGSKGSFIAAFQLPLPAPAEVTDLTVDVLITGGPGMPGMPSPTPAPAGSSIASSATVTLRNHTSGAWDVIAAGKPVPNASGYVDENGEVEVKVRMSGGSGGYVNVSISANGRKRQD